MSQIIKIIACTTTAIVSPCIPTDKENTARSCRPNKVVMVCPSSQHLCITPMWAHHIHRTWRNQQRKFPQDDCDTKCKKPFSKKAHAQDFLSISVSITKTAERGIIKSRGWRCFQHRKAANLVYAKRNLTSANSIYGPIWWRCDRPRNNIENSELGT